MFRVVFTAVSGRVRVIFRHLGRLILTVSGSLFVAGCSSSSSKTVPTAVPTATATAPQTSTGPDYLAALRASKYVLVYEAGFDAVSPTSGTRQNADATASGQPLTWDGLNFSATQTYNAGTTGELRITTSGTMTADGKTIASLRETLSTSPGAAQSTFQWNFANLGNTQSGSDATYGPYWTTNVTGAPATAALAVATLTTPQGQIPIGPRGGDPAPQLIVVFSQGQAPLCFPRGTCK